MLVPNERRRRHIRIEPATTLAEIPQTLAAEPLETAEELKAYYRPEIQTVRGADRIGAMQICMEDAFAADLPFKGFLLGHPGVGKTTELSRILLLLKDRCRPLRLNVASELNPGTLRFYDVLLLILIRLVQEASSPQIIGFEDNDLKLLLDKVRDHLRTKWTKHLRVDAAEFGAGLSLPFVKLLGNIKQGRTREEGSQEYELSFVSELVGLMNDVLAECNRLLKKHQQGRQWMIVLEDLEKIGLAPSAIKDLFTGLRPSLQSLDAHFIVVIPVWLRYSEDALVVLPPNFDSFVLLDIAIYQQNHERDAEVLAALESVVKARVDETLFEPGVLDLVSAASGGNLRDLFLLIRDGMVSARLRKSTTISIVDAKGAIAKLRNDYKQWLGSTEADGNDTSLSDRLDRLVALYKREDKKAEVPDRILYQLLKQRCALQYNGAGWTGVHPLVVDLLMDFEKLPAGSPGGSGT